VPVKRILLPSPWIRILKSEVVKGVAPVTAAPLIVRFGKLPVPPWPDAQPFSIQVSVAVSRTR
jgi:hypothetical protein